MKIFLLIITTIVYFTCCKDQSKKNNVLSNLEGTKWEWKLDDNCISYLKFINGMEYKEYNCELGEAKKNSYLIKNDTLILKEDIYTSNIPNKGKFVTNTYKMIIDSIGLAIVYSKIFKNGIWEEQWIKNPKIYFKKVE